MALGLHSFSNGLHAHPDLSGPNPVAPSCSYPPKLPDTIRIVCISDTHSRHRQLNVPEGDVLLHAGDFTQQGLENEIIDFNEWIGTLPHPHKIVIAGNRDFWLQVYPRTRELLTNCTYLCHQTISVHDIRIFGSPWTMKHAGAFQLNDVEEAKARWVKLPETGAEIVLTHGPCYGILDKAGKVPMFKTHEGDVALLEAVQKLNPKLVVCGHIHEAYGACRVDGCRTLFMNVAQANFLYSRTPRPGTAVVVDYPLPTSRTHELNPDRLPVIVKPIEGIVS